MRVVEHRLGNAPEEELTAGGPASGSDDDRCRTQLACVLAEGDGDSACASEAAAKRDDDRLLVVAADRLALVR